MTGTKALEVSAVYVDLSTDEAELRKVLDALTPPQRAALVLFKPNQRRRAFPAARPLCGVRVCSKA
jgi:hypothetical protein